MERSKLKLAVIFLLAAVNLFLLGSVVLQRQQSQGYAAALQEQTLPTSAAGASPWRRRPSPGRAA